jgi:hypothetical protein
MCRLRHGHRGTSVALDIQASHSGQSFRPVIQASHSGQSFRPVIQASLNHHYAIACQHHNMADLPHRKSTLLTVHFVPGLSLSARRMYTSREHVTPVSVT